MHIARQFTHLSRDTDTQTHSYISFTGTQDETEGELEGVTLKACHGEI